MKKIFKLALIGLVTLTLVIQSCTNDDINTSKTAVAKLPDIIQTTITEYKKTQGSGIQKGGHVTFDVDNTTETYNDGNGMQVFTANQFGFDPNNDSNYGLCIYVKNNVVVDEIIVQTEKVLGIYRIHYYETDWNEFLAFDLDPSTQTITTSTNNPRKKKPCTGQAVMDCIDDAYTNHGWVSVWLTFQSIYIPATGGAIIAACYDRNC